MMALANRVNREGRHDVLFSIQPHEQVLTCTICLDTFRKPKFLPCFHTFCRLCLEQQIERTCKSQRFPCPLCRTSIKIPSSGVDGFQTNFYVQEILGILARSKVRESEDDQVDVASEMNAEADEEQEEEEDEQVQVVSDLVCPKHVAEKEWLTSYCNQCHVPTCTRCVLYDHYGHEAKPLSVALDEAQRCLQTLNFRIHRYHNLTRELIKDRQRYIDSYIWQLGSVADQVSSNAEEIKMAVDTRAQTLLNLLENLKVTEVNRLEVHELAMAAYLQSLNEVKDQVGYLMSSANVADTLNCYRLLRDKGERVMKLMPKAIDKYSVVYDGVLVEGMEKRIEEALGYLHTEKDQNFERQVEPDVPADIVQGTEVRGRFSNVMPEVTSRSLDTLNGETFKSRAQSGHIRIIVPVRTVGAWIGYSSAVPYMDLVTTTGLIVQSIKVTGSVTDAVMLQGEQLVLARNNPNRLSVWETKVHQVARQVKHIPLSIQPSGIAVRNSRELFVCGKDDILGESSVYIVHLDTKFVTSFFRDGVMNPLRSPSKIVYYGSESDDDVVCVSDSKRRQVYFFTSEGACLSVFPATKCSSCPEGICLDKKGNIVMADKGNNSVIVLTTKGEFVKELIRGGTGLAGPQAVAVDDVGRLWVGDSRGYVSVFYNQLLY